MTTAFSTKSNQNIEDPLYRLLFSEDEEQEQPKNKIDESKHIKTEQTTIKKDEQKIVDTQTEIQIDEPKIEQIEFNPIIIKPEKELDKENKSSILEHLVYNLNKLKIPHNIKTFGYHTTDDFITTEYTVIDENSKNTILIVHLSKKQVRYQVPSHQKENKKLSKFAKDFQKQLKYTWLEWF